MLRAFFFLCLGVLIAWGAGFVLFVRLTSFYVEPLIDATIEPVDAIVVLTGGSERIGTGLDLLVAGKAKKLFISGVYPGLTLGQVIGKQQISDDLKKCCVVLGHAADNTIGNAEETKLWMRAEGYQSLRLVTAHYHMPRSLVVFEKQMPSVKIVPHPVVPESVHLEQWWEHAGSAHLLLREYNKYLVVALGNFLEKD